VSVKIYTEKYLERKLGEELRKNGGWAIKLPASFVAGLPDRLCLLPGGRVIFAEIKETGKKPTEIQRFIHGKLRAMGFEVLVVDSYSVIEDIIGRV
jgi:Holliday junction resolvase